MTERTITQRGCKFYYNNKTYHSLTSALTALRSDQALEAMK